MPEERNRAEGRQPLAHVNALDGLRFLAAATVLVGHSWNCLVKPADFDIAFRQSPLTLLINGYGAVHLFFILSGFCLAGSANRVRNRGDLAQFYTRRIFRIHPPYMYALLLAWLASFFYDTSRAGGGLEAVALNMSAVHLSPRELLPYFLYPSHAADQLNPAWSLSIEMGFSLLLPAMLWLTRKTHWTVLLAASLYPLLYAGHVPEFFLYGFHFALGIAVFQEQTRLRRWADRLPGVGRLAILFLGLGVFASPWMLDVVFRPDFTYRPMGMGLSGAGGALLLGAALFFPRTNGFLSSRPLVYGGKRSYSFFLLHYPIMLLLTKIIHGPVGWPEGLGFIVLVFVATGAAAAISFPLVELPAIRAGNMICNAIARRAAAGVQVSRLA